MNIQDIEEVRKGVLSKYDSEIQVVFLDESKLKDFWSSQTKAQKDKIFLIQVEEMVQLFVSYLQYMFYMDGRLYNKNIYIDNLIICDFKRLNLQIPEPFQSQLRQYILIQNQNQEILQHYTIENLEKNYVADMNSYQHQQSALKIQLNELDNNFNQIMELYKDISNYTVIPKHLEHKFFLDFINKEQNIQNYYGNYKLIPLINAINHLYFNRVVLGTYKCFQKKLRLQKQVVYKSLLSRKCFDCLSFTIKQGQTIFFDDQDTSDSENIPIFSLDLLQVPIQKSCSQNEHYINQNLSPYQSFQSNYQRLAYF